MIKLDIVNHVAEKTGVPKQKAEQVVDSLFNAMKDALAKGKRIELRGFGVFVVKPRKRGVGRNPRTGMEVPIHFKPVKTNDGATWEIACAQLCGLGHYRMRGAVTVHNKADYEKWLREVPRVGATLSGL